MASLNNLKQEADVKNEDTDSLGGVYLVDSGVYPVTIELAYIDTSAAGAMSLNLHFKGNNGEFIKQTLWIKSGTKKGGKENAKEFIVTPKIIYNDFIWDKKKDN